MLFTYFMCISFPPSLTMMHLCITQCTYWTPLLPAYTSRLICNSYSFIQEFIRRPFKKYTLRRPSPSTAMQISLKQPAKRTFIIFRRETDFQGEFIPGGGTNSGECATLPSCSFSTRRQ